MADKQANKFCPFGDRNCTGGSDCAVCGQHICSYWAAAFDFKTGKVYHPRCADYLHGKSN